MKSGFVSLVGRPNAGKSTLINRLVRAKVAIVSDKPQTTRTRILGVRTMPEGQVVYVDTPGIHKPVHRMNARMVESALGTLREVDVLVWVLDASEPAGGGVRYVSGLLSKASQPVLLALNKIDRMAKPALLPIIEALRRERDFADIVPISALTGDGVEALERAILARLPDGEPLYPDDYLTDQPERAYVAEVVREKLLHHLRDELPYTTAVLVEQFDEPDAAGLMRVACVILVESPSQKAIVIGRDGSMIKRVGTEARTELEGFFDCRMFLGLHVKVRADWREDERVLDELGLGRGRH
jgi:GTP-binding protein Era